MRKYSSRCTFIPPSNADNRVYSGLVKGVDKAPNIKADDIETMFSTNVTGLINMTQVILPLYNAHTPPRGDIINIGSIAGREGYPSGSIYCATKAAVRTFTDALRRELISTRIRVMEIDPGQVETEFSVVRFYGDKDKAKKVYEGCEPLTPDDIAETVVWAAGRRENVVIADMLVFPNHQVCCTAKIERTTNILGDVLMRCRLLLLLCIRKDSKCDIYCNLPKSKMLAQANEHFSSSTPFHRLRFWGHWGPHLSNQDKESPITGSSPHPLARCVATKCTCVKF
jgi:hypothetical protein